ncbi:MAG: type II secretion system protein, partial [Candidatus Nanoperiomorbaceae bacterium]
NISPPSLSSVFTIIEVALVLAIAGLIFLVVFIAWPALQNSQADTARRQDVNRVVSGLESYKVDHQGDLSGLADAPGGSWRRANAIGLDGYIGKPSAATDVSVSPAGAGPGTPSSNNVDVFIGFVCPNDTRTATSANAAVMVRLSSGKAYCASV